MTVTKRCPHGILRHLFACPGCGDKEEPPTRKRRRSVTKHSRSNEFAGYGKWQPQEKVRG